ncbi:hypothetical protein HU200_019181 [Digitaria exilis]|uniref:BRCA1-associated 2/ETP1 RRM domain-containing protein n=1 Tax=Digitaria exilis TaxID=1010633 RepID=A0A835F2X9_9POAL|nr:hypothetical protein HU200_019181 [Digitaria exilis]
MATAGKPAASMTPSAAPFSAAQSVDLVFYSGNPRIEERRVVVTFHPDACASSSSFHLPVIPAFQFQVERKPRVCVLTVPNNMTYADFWRFCGEFANQALAMRIVRCLPYHYYVLLITLHAIASFLRNQWVKMMPFSLQIGQLMPVTKKTNFDVLLWSHGVDDKYSVLINFETQKSADDFYQHFNGKQFSPLEVAICFDSAEL